MPGGNRTGPAGMGPMTGRGAGFCAGYAAPGCANPVGGRGYGIGFGRGMGRGRGFGRGFGWAGQGRFGWFGGQGAFAEQQNISVEQEVEALKGQAGYLEDSLKQIDQRLKELQNQNK